MPINPARSFALAPSLALALLGLLGALPPAARAQGVTVTDITPAVSAETYAQAVDGGAVAGESVGAVDHALLFTTAGGPGVDLNPAGFDSSDALALSGGLQAGSGEGPATVYYTHALVWRGTAASATDINPAGYIDSRAAAVSGAAVVGTGLPSGNYQYMEHALLWPSATAASAVDLNPAGFTSSNGEGVLGTTVVGDGIGPNTGNDQHALVWTRGTAASATDINPAGYTDSTAFALAADGSVVGDGTNGAGTHALVWTNGTAASAVDLNPAGFPTSEALAAAGGLQAGYAYNGGSSGTQEHAFLWRGTAASAVDLNAFLPAGYNDGSQAFGIDAAGDVVGEGYGSAGTHAFLWHVSSGVSVSGAVSLQGVTSGNLAQPITFTFTPTGGTTGAVPAQTVTPNASDGSFTLSGVPGGTYTLGIKGAKWLRRDVTVDTTGGSVSGLSVSLLGGDVNNDNQVSLQDLGALRRAYGSTPKSPNWDPAADLNCDGQVSLQDLGILRSNYGKVGDK